MRLFGLSKRYKHYANAPPCYVVYTMPVLLYSADVYPAVMYSLYIITYPAVVRLCFGVFCVFGVTTRMRKLMLSNYRVCYVCVCVFPGQQKH